MSVRNFPKLNLVNFQVERKIKKKNQNETSDLYDVGRYV